VRNEGFIPHAAIPALPLKPVHAAPARAQLASLQKT